MGCTWCGGSGRDNRGGWDLPCSFCYDTKPAQPQKEEIKKKCQMCGSTNNDDDWDSICPDCMGTQIKDR